VEASNQQARQIEGEKISLNEMLEEARSQHGRLSEELQGAKQESERLAGEINRLEEEVKDAVREKEENEMEYMQEMEAKQDHYIKELERVRSANIAEMTKMNHNYLQRGKALKIAELEIQRLKEKIAELEKRPAAARTPRAAARHGPGKGPAPLPSAGGSEGGDFDIDEVLDGLKESD
jgi:chromosome segregation ATPase